MIVCKLKAPHGAGCCVSEEEHRCGSQFQPACRKAPILTEIGDSWTQPLIELPDALSALQ